MVTTSIALLFALAAPTADTPCSKDAPDACYLAAKELQRLPASDVNSARAEALLRTGCDGYHGGSCRLLAESDTLLKKRPLWRRACRYGDDEGCKELARRLLRDGDVRKVHEGVEVLSEQCEKHPSECQDYLREKRRVVRKFDALCGGDWDKSWACVALRKLGKLPEESPNAVKIDKEALVASCLSGPIAACAPASTYFFSRGHQRQALILVRHGCAAEDLASCVRMAAWARGEERQAAAGFACENGNPASCHHVARALWLEGGRGEEAVAVMATACRADKSVCVDYRAFNESYLGQLNVACKLELHYPGQPQTGACARRDAARAATIAR